MAEENKNESARTWAMLCHLSSLLWIPLSLSTILLIGIPISLIFLNILGPLIIWMLKKKQHPLIDAHGKESLNFQITLLLYSLVIGVVLLLSVGSCWLGFSTNSSAILGFVGLGLIVAGVGLAILGGLMGLILWLGQLLLTLFASIKAKKGELYRYPYTIRLLR
ncbi:DUF4870 domain-containing protein [Microcoleus sp. FACHB-672]|uniref:DUF4870 domain-containing protein n=1 Tax=Microcoleus sp. FACHB-672 TaxID=2692825 RepID=UPI0018EFB095|nr:DUF4870 domain-containing protein [Microcoleus sp. FACHB-672]